MAFADRTEKLSPTAVNQVLKEIRERTSAGHTVLSLVRGQPDSPTPAHIVEAGQEAIRSGRTGYADNLGEPSLRRAVASRIESDSGPTYQPDREILITDGATGGLFAAFGALLNPGDPVLVPDPVYDAYAGPISTWGGRAVSVSSQVKPSRFEIDRTALENAWIPAARVLLLNSPWNPTGTVFGREELEAIVAFATERNLWIVSDEIYEGLVYDGRKFRSAASIDACRSRLVLVNSLSKSYAMTGWRVGYVAGPEEVIRRVFLIWQQFSRGPATFVQDAAVAALSGDQSCVRQMADEFQRRRDQVVRTLSGLPGVRPIVPEGGLFVMIDVRELLERGPSGIHTSNELRRHLLVEHGVAVIHGSAYGPGGEGTLRVSFAAADPLESGLARLRQALITLS